MGHSGNERQAAGLPRDGRGQGRRSPYAHRDDAQRTVGISATRAACATRLEKRCRLANRLAVCEGEITREMLEEITGADAKTALVGEEEQKQADSENVAQLAEKGEQE